MIALLLFAFAAGVLTILSPCILPMVPLVLGTAAGGGRGRPVGIVLGLAASFTLFSVVLAAALAALGWTTTGLRGLAVVALLVAGSALLVPAFGARLEALLAPLAGRAPRSAPGRGGLGGGLLVGAALGLVWAPCAGPIMATVLALAVTRGAEAPAAAVAMAYALGAGVPLLAIAYGGRALVHWSALRRGSGIVRRVFGALVLVTCVAILFNLDLPAQDAVDGLLPAGWTARIFSLEAAPPVQQALTRLQQQPALPAVPTPAAPAPARQVAVAPAAPTTPPTLPPTAASTATAVPPTAGPALPLPVADELPANVPLEDKGLAPEITGITDWINSAPLTLASLRGEVVLVHFWTFECINCIHVQPYVKSWYARYHDAGFTVVGVHTPELSFERDIANVRNAVRDSSVIFPVAFDPKYATWNAYHNGYWPAFYYVDKSGHIRYTHVGEGDYAGQEQVIRELLSEPGS